MTKAIVDIAAPLGIAAHDHIIVGESGNAERSWWRSFRGFQFAILGRRQGFGE